VHTLRRALAQPADAASLAAFRVLFGLLMAASALRFMLSGWVERCYGDRSFFFKYWGFSWVHALPVSGMFGLYGALAILGLCIALGFYYRVAIVLFGLLFTYVELIDVTNYLNHYYLVSLLTLLMSFMPLSQVWSLDAHHNGNARATHPSWMLYVLRFQTAVVYVFAAKAKWGADWLVWGEPLRSWLLPQVDVPWLGPFLAHPHAALVLGWAGMLHDLSVPALLLEPRSRPYAYGALLFFHLATSHWFNIGIFPLLMPLCATLFFSPDWPRRLLKLKAPPLTHARLKLCTWPCTVLLLLYVGYQLLMPLRSHLYGGNVLWHEQGMRYSWRVLVRSKQGSIRYRAYFHDGRELHITPRKYLTQDQEREFAGQPDLIVQLGHHIAADLKARGHAPERLEVDAMVSLNGRPPMTMIDPHQDLLRIRDGVAKAAWITRGP
jgi:vitamin K-dependent gamma-carboxylase